MLCTGNAIVCAQDSWQHFYETLAENSDEEEEELALLYETLSEVAENPLDINTITAEQLQELLCFSDVQIEYITNFIHRYGPIRSKGELLMIPGLDEARRGLLSALTYIGEGRKRALTELDSLSVSGMRRQERRTFTNSAHRGEVVTALQVPFYERKGNREGYAGGPLKHWLRVGYNIDQHMKVGFVASQDAGEPFFSGKNKAGYDFYSAYFRLQRMGALKNLVVGRYRIRNAMGLAISNNLPFGKSFSVVPSSQSTSTAILPHSSKTESNYMQGLAATIALGKSLETTVFASWRAIDATLTDDSTAIKTILRTGYHRTASELQRKGNAWQTVAGAVARLKISSLSIGMTGLWTHYSMPLRPYEQGSGLSQLYRMHFPAGNNFWNASIDYSWRMGKQLNISGETATDKHGRLATANAVAWRINGKLTLTAIQRFFPFRFWSVMGRSFSEGGTNQDESGLYVGATWSPTARLSVSAYSDIAYFAWPKYQALGSSHSFDNLLQAEYKFTAHSSLNMRYRIKLRQKDASTSDNQELMGVLWYKNEQRLRLAHNYRQNRLALKTQADFSFCHHRENSFGGMLSETVTYTLKPWKIAAAAAYFHTRDFNSRLYAYEQSTPYTLSFPAFYGSGLRTFAYAEVLTLKRLTVMGKVGFTIYFDRDAIGSGYQRINSNHQTDLELMARLWL